MKKDENALVERRLLVNPYPSLERGKGIRVAEWLVGRKVGVVLSRER